ncbi:MAG TPA: hypothetical protein DD637_02980 [Verrucomicrobia bacterium]|nr:hypothetical protein [Verrucomicrobiota bacterium]
MKKINYYVIGGQYEFFCHGGTPTLLGAKRLARKCQEYWDNWAGWHTPDIYAAEDCCRLDNGDIVPDRETQDARPVATWDNDAKRWIED